MTYTWFLFDADGTLFDYDAAEREALEMTFDQFGLAFGPTVLETYRRVNHRMWLDFEEGKTTSERIKRGRFQRLFVELEGTEDAAPVSPDVASFSSSYLANLGTCVHLMPEAEAVLAALRARVRLALITNGLTSVQRARLSRSGLEQVFDALVISEEVGVSKPDPRIFEIALRRMGSPDKSDVLMIGDSLTSDIRGANAAGIDACWYNPGRKAPIPGVTARYEIRDLTELLALVDGANG